jgi:hypothetical protein
MAPHVQTALIVLGIMTIIIFLLVVPKNRNKSKDENISK